jgi:hypothetical protein
MRKRTLRGKVQLFLMSRIEIFNQNVWRISIHDEYENKCCAKSWKRKMSQAKFGKGIKFLPPLFIPFDSAKPEIWSLLLIQRGKGQDIYGKGEAIIGFISQLKVGQNSIPYSHIVLMKNGKGLMQIVQT